MITVLASAALSPFMVAAPEETSAAAPTETPVAYNWETQSVDAIVTEDELKAGGMASFSYINGIGQTMDDWHLC